MPIGWQELLIVLVILLIVFGAGKLAGVGGALGSSVKEFRRASRDDDSPKTAATDPDTTEPAATAPRS